MTSRQLRLLLASVGVAFFYAALLIGLYKRQWPLVAAGIAGGSVFISQLRKALKSPAFTDRELAIHNTKIARKRFPHSF